MSTEPFPALMVVVRVRLRRVGDVVKLLVDGSSTKINPCHQEIRMLVYPLAIGLSTRTLTFLAELLAAHRCGIGSRWRKLPAGQRALLVLAHLRCGDTYARLAAGFGVGVATVYWYIREAVEALATLTRPVATPYAWPRPPRT